EAAERAPWAGAFCLYITGMYGSEYEGEPAGWSSRSIEEALGGALTDEERTELLVTGLAFWKRSPRARDGMPDLAYVLRREAGLPWRAVATQLPRMDAAIRHALRHFQSPAAGGRTVSELLVEEVQDLPPFFRQLDTRLLLAGIVEQLMQLAAAHP